MSNKVISIKVLSLTSLSVIAICVASPALADPTAPCNDGPGLLSTECGTDSSATGAFTTALGNLSRAIGLEGTALGVDSLAAGDTSVAVGTIATANGAASTAVGVRALADAASSTAVGANSSATGVQSTAIGQGAVASGTNSVALGTNSVATQANTVSVGTVGGERRVVNVAAGTSATDAVNFGQLTTTNNNVLALQAADTAFDGRIDSLETITSNLDDRIDRFDNRAASGTAVAIALSGGAFLPDKRVNITANVGTYRGAVAGAFQVGAMISPNAAVNAGVATGFNKNGKVGARAGVTFGF